MALSEQEQKLLAQLEASLAADDPELARTLRGSSTDRPAAPRRLGLAVFGLLVGLGGLVAGVQLHPLVSVLGFLLMLASVLVARGMVAPRGDQHAEPRRPSTPPRPSTSGPFPTRPHRADEGH